MLLMYKVVELNGALVIMHQHDAMQDNRGTPLIIADSGTMVEYLARYIHAREAGKAQKDAHKSALDGAKILGRGTLDG